MKLIKLEKYGNEKQLASVSSSGIHKGKSGECVPHITLGNGDHSYRLDMTPEEANELIKQLRESINEYQNTSQNGLRASWYNLDEINPDLML